jgi:hypothetical protein
MCELVNMPYDEAHPIYIITVFVNLDRYSTCTAGKHWECFGENPGEHACFRGMHAIVLGLAMAMHGFSCFN